MRLDHLLSKESSKGCFTVQLSGDWQGHLVPIRPGDTPVPIPNTMVKTRAADGTMLETAWESRRLPDIFFEKALRESARAEQRVSFFNIDPSLCMR